MVFVVLWIELIFEGKFQNSEIEKYPGYNFNLFSSFHREQIFWKAFSRKTFIFLSSPNPRLNIEVDALTKCTTPWGVLYHCSSDFVKQEGYISLVSMR